MTKESLRGVIDSIPLTSGDGGRNDGNLVYECAQFILP